MSTCTAVDRLITTSSLEKTIESTEDTWGICEILAANASDSYDAIVEFYVGKDRNNLTFLGKYVLKPIPDSEQSTVYKGAIAPNEALYVRLVSGTASIRATLISEVSFLTNGKSSTIGYTKKETNTLLEELQNKLIDMIKNGNIPEPTVPDTTDPIIPTKPDIKTLNKTFSASYEESTVYQFTLSGVIDPAGELVRYKITNILGGVVFDKTSNIAPNEKVQMIMPPVVESTSASFDIIAISSDSVASDPARINLVIKDVVYIAPDVSKATTTLTSDIHENTSVVVTFNNITDNSGNEIKLELVLPPELEAQKTKDINVGEFITLKANAVTNTKAVKVKVLATNKIGASTLTFPINIINKVSLPPVVDNLSIDLPSDLEYNKTYPMTFKNAIDPEGEAVTINITTINGATVDTASNIPLNSAITLTTTNNKLIDKVTFIAIALDPDGSQSTPTTFTRNILPPVNHDPDLTNLSLGIPNNTVVSGTDNNITFGGILDADDDTLDITLSGDVAVRCSEFEHIKVTDTIVFNAPTLSDDSDQVMELTVTVSDGNGGLATKTLNITVTP